MFNRNGDLEQKPAKNDDADAKSPERHDFDLGKVVKEVGDAAGKVQNDMIERLTNAHVKQQYVANISPALANQYVRGRDIMQSRSQSGKSATDLSDLSTAERKATEVYQRLHSDLPSKIPFYNRETLANDLDRDIARKARSQPVASPAVALAAAETKPRSRAAKSELRSAARAEAGAKLDAKSVSKLAAKPDSKTDQKLVSKPDSKSESRVLSHPESKVNPKAPAKSDSKIDVRGDSRPNAIAVEKVLPTKKDVPNSTIAAAAPGNALLTALGKNKEGSENRNSPRLNGLQQNSYQQVVQSSAMARLEHEKKEMKVAPQMVAHKDTNSELSPASKLETKSESKPALKQEPKQELKQELKQVPKQELGQEFRHELKPAVTPQLKPELKSELKPEPKAEPKFAPVQTARSDKQEVGCGRRDETKVLPSSSSSERSSSPNVRLIHVSQSNIAAVHRDDKINVVRQLSDRTACSFIRVLIAPTPQTSSKPDIKPNAPTTEKKGQQIDSSRGQNQVSSAVPKPVFKIEPEANLKIDSKPFSISDSPAGKPYSSSKTGEPLVDRSNIDIAQEKFVDSQKPLKGYRLKCQDADLKYITGPEIALSAIIALAGIAKLRTDQSMWQIDSAISATYFATEQSTETRKGETETSSSVLIRPRILVGKNDSLVSIAEQLFNDSGIAWLILQLNSELLPLQIEGKTVVRLRSRQEIFIPVYQDIIDFQKSRTKEMSGQSLITVVEENQIDREVVDLAIAPMLGHNSSNLDPFQSLQPLEIVSEEEG